MSESSCFGFLSPPIDAGDASSDDGDTLQTPLTDENHLAYDVYAQEAHQFKEESYPHYEENKQHSGEGAIQLGLDAYTHTFPSLMNSSTSESLQQTQQDQFFASLSPPDALDLANASLEISFTANTFNTHILDPTASPFTPSKQYFDLPSVHSTSSGEPSSISEYLPPLPSFSIDTFTSNAHPSEQSSLFLSSPCPSPSPSSPRPPLKHSFTAPELPALGRVYSPRFPAAHILNPFFVRTYDLGDELGAGGYGFVMTARHRTEGHEVAVKFIVKEKVPEHAWWEDPQVGRVPTEVMLLSLVDHPGIVKCLDLYEDEVYYYMVQELHGSPWVSKRKKKVKQVTAPGKLVVPTPSSTPLLTPSPSFESTTDSLPHTPPSASIESVDSLPSVSASAQETWHTGQDPAHITSPIASSSVFTVPSIDISAHIESKDRQQLALLQPDLAIRPRFGRRPSHDLFECIEQSKHKRLSESQARYVFAQVVEAIYYLDSQGITHCDIKDENLLVDSDLKVKLIDFGSAVAVDPSLPRPFYTLFFGTTAYASSEILRKQPYQAPPAEVWTLGVLLSYLLTGHSPFPTEQDAIEGRVALREPSSGRLSRAAVALMGRCLERDPERRADIAEVRQHRWLQGALERGARD